MYDVGTILLAMMGIVWADIFHRSQIVIVECCEAQMKWDRVLRSRSTLSTWRLNMKQSYTFFDMRTPPVKLLIFCRVPVHARFSWCILYVVTTNSAVTKDLIWRFRVLQNFPWKGSVTWLVPFGIKLHRHGPPPHFNPSGCWRNL